MSESGSEPSRLDAISTRWSLIGQARGGSTISSAEARNALVLRYLPAARRYIQAMVENPADAEDLTQDVLLRLLAGDFAGASPERGRFRDLLKVSLRNMVRNYWTRQKRRRPAAQAVDDLPDCTAGTEDPWIAAWRASVLELTFHALEQQQRSRPGNTLYTVLRLRADHPEDDSEQLAQRLSKRLGKMVRPDALRQQLRRARLQFADLLVTELARGLSDPTPQRIEDELIALDLMEYVRDLLPAAWSGG